jgi:large subunit ribosomal protein L15
MKLSKLKKQVNKGTKRVGRGISAGQGKTAGRGTKGQNSRTGGGTRPGFEGGQMPLVQRIPKKRGFTARKSKPATITLASLSGLKDGDKITVEFLLKSGVLKRKVKAVKIVGEAKEIKKVTVCVPISKKSAELVLKAGGKIDLYK